MRGVFLIAIGTLDDTYFDSHIYSIEFQDTTGHRDQMTDQDIGRGYSDHIRGRDVSENPYETGTDQHSGWTAGYHRAARDLDTFRRRAVPVVRDVAA